MGVVEFEDFLNLVVQHFENLRRIHGKDEAMRRVAPFVHECCSTFEEETLVERLKESWLKAA